MLIVLQIVEELLATAPSQAQTSESDACASGLSVMEHENVIQSGLESVTICSGQTKRHARVQARPQTKSKGKPCDTSGYPSPSRV